MWRPSLSSSERSKSISRLTPARRAADKSIGFGRANIDWPDLLPRLVMILSHHKDEDAYCRTIFASRPNWSTLRVTRSNVSKISSSLLVVPQPAKRITSNVNTQNTVTTRSKTLKGCFQNCCPMSRRQSAERPNSGSPYHSRGRKQGSGSSLPQSLPS